MLEVLMLLCNKCFAHITVIRVLVATETISPLSDRANTIEQLWRHRTPKLGEES
jgi:hypothetical protein